MEIIKKPLPNSTATLVLGITSIVSCWTYGLVGVILAIIALAISVSPLKMYRENPDQYSGIENLRAGRIMAIIGLALSGMMLLIFIILITVIGTAVFSLDSLFNHLSF